MPALFHGPRRGRRERGTSRALRATPGVGLGVVAPRFTLPMSAVPHGVDENSKVTAHVYLYEAKRWLSRVDLHTHRIYSISAPSRNLKHRSH